MDRTTRQTRRLSAVLLALAAFAVLTCEEPPHSVLELTITEQPQGGTNVDGLRCTFEGYAWSTTGGQGDISRAIYVTAEWESPDQYYGRTIVGWYKYGETKTATVEKWAPQGMHLDKPFWCTITWTDAEGDKKLVSDTAYCN